MMKKIKIKWLAILLSMAPLVGFALEFDEIRDFDDVFKVSARATGRDRIELRWDIAEEYYLYNNKFLVFSTDRPGVVLGPPEIPEGERKYDD